MASKLNVNTLAGFRSIDEIETVQQTRVAKEIKLTEENKKNHPPYDPWEIMVEYEIPRPPQGESIMMSVHINRTGGSEYVAFFPRGKRQKFPLPVYQVIARAVKQEDNHRQLADDMSGDFLLSVKQ